MPDLPEQDWSGLEGCLICWAGLFILLRQIRQSGTLPKLVISLGYVDALRYLLWPPKLILGHFSLYVESTFTVLFQVYCWKSENLKIRRLPDKSGSDPSKSRWVPDWSGSCHIEIKQVPDWSGDHHIKIRRLPDWSGSCQIKIRQAPDWSGNHHIKIRRVPDWN